MFVLSEPRQINGRPSEAGAVIRVLAEYHNGDEQMSDEICTCAGENNDGLPELPADECLYELAELFRVFGDSTRVKILYALLDRELCVGDIAEALGISQSAVSHQLRVLKGAKLVRFRREGKSVFYMLDDDHVRTILSMGMEHVEE